ncbi:stAR-related lipid transfer protein 5-like [Glandiceps talaboti]
MSFCEAFQTFRLNVRRQNTRVYRTLSESAMMGLVSPREFINVIQEKKFTDSKGDFYRIYHDHVDHPRCPVSSGHVRGIGYPSGTFIYPVEGDQNKSFVITFTQQDVKLFAKTFVEMMIPRTLVNHIKQMMRLVNEANL